jgi:hypothetical protein
MLKLISTDLTLDAAAIEGVPSRTFQGSPFPTVSPLLSAMGQK